MNRAEAHGLAARPPLTGPRLEEAGNRRATRGTACVGRQIPLEQLVPVAHDERGAAARATGGAARAIVHVPLNFQSILIILALGVVITSKVTKYVNADRPLWSVLKAAWNDLNAPRPPKVGQTVVLRIPAAFHTPRSAQDTVSNEGNVSR